ncbi:MAG: hypothetical protein K0B10_07255 [Vicingaceae bacterium]|nr:hypothetical protein [Vicingaceae bacterium]
MEKTIKIIEKLFEEADYLLENKKISAKYYHRKTQYYNCLLEDIISRELYVDSLNKKIDKLKNEKEKESFYTSFFYQLLDLLGCSPSFYLQKNINIKDFLQAAVELRMMNKEKKYNPMQLSFCLISILILKKITELKKLTNHYQLNQYARSSN